MGYEFNPYKVDQAFLIYFIFFLLHQRIARHRSGPTKKKVEWKNDGKEFNKQQKISCIVTFFI